MKGFWHSLLGIKGEDKPSRIGLFVADLLTSTEYSDREALAEDHEIQEMRDQLRYERISLLEKLGKPRANGRWDAAQMRIWDTIRELDCKDKQIIDNTEVVNLEPLGHNIGRRWKRR